MGSFTPEEYERRFAQITSRMHETGVDTLVVSVFQSLLWLMGMSFDPVNRKVLIVIRRDGDRVVIVPLMELEHLSHGSPHLAFRSYFEHPAKVGNRWEDELLRTLENPMAAGKVAVEARGTADILGLLHAEKFDVRVTELVDEAQMVKSEVEIEMMRLSADYASFGMRRILQELHLGMPVLQAFAIGREIQRRMIRNSDFNALLSYVLTGAWIGPSCLPHGVPDIDDGFGTSGSHVLFSFTGVKGYRAEFERTVFLGEPTTTQIHRFEMMRGARKIVFDMLRPGVACHDIAVKVEAFWSRMGFGRNDTLHRPGHGFGLQTFHNLPYIALGSPHVLLPGMLVSNEPGLYVDGTYRHSDVILITEDGYEILTKGFPTDIESCTVRGYKPIKRAKGLYIKRDYRV